MFSFELSRSAFSPTVSRSSERYIRGFGYPWPGCLFKPCPGGRLELGSVAIDGGDVSAGANAPAMGPTASPETFMNVWGWARTAGSPAILPEPRTDLNRFSRKEIPCRSASLSTTSNPTLCRVRA